MGASGNDATKTCQRRRRPVRVPATCPSGRNGLRKIRQGHALSHHPVRSVRIPGQAPISASQAGSGWLGSTSNTAEPQIKHPGKPIDPDLQDAALVYGLKGRKVGNQVLFRLSFIKSTGTDGTSVTTSCGDRTGIWIWFAARKFRQARRKSAETTTAVCLIPLEWAASSF